eukprot:9166018-Heterocapsa_arctica.AAC.1
MNIQRLVYGGRQLNDERTLSSYKIENGSTVDLNLRLPAGGGDVNDNYLINVRLHTDQNLRLVVKSSTTIGDIKCKIQQK